MDKDLDPNKAFPSEVLELQSAGVPLPTWFAGPLYTANGSSAALETLDGVRARAAEAEDAAATDEAPADF